MGTLRIADSNYGMFERDIEISGYIGEMQRDYGWPTYIDATTGKNRPERIIKSLEKVNGALVLYQAVQSLDEEMLRKIKRENISSRPTRQVMIHVRGRGLRSVSDLILGLPGETLQTHLDGLHQLIDCNTHEMHNFQAMMLKGSELEIAGVARSCSTSTRASACCPKNYGVYDGEKVFDVDEIIVATDTLTFDDYLTCRKWHLVSSVFWNNSWFEDVGATSPARSASGLPNGGRACCRRWRTATRRCAASSMQLRHRDQGRAVPDAARPASSSTPGPRTSPRLQRGEIGDNLMYRYRAIASFYIWQEVCDAAMNATRRAARGARRRPPDRATSTQFWKDLHTYIAADSCVGPRQQRDPVVGDDGSPVRHPRRGSRAAT